VEDDVKKEFSTLDAQREAGEAYITSQKSNGWVCLPERYDDDGFSGGNMKRPALQRLLADAEAGLIDVIVVYKIDRLSRSILDFGELSKKLDKWGVSFVAVTQEINTSTSSGRMMLNILMTFAQYEREVIAERVRDKMAASRKKGKWVGGSVPMGYEVINKKLVIVPDGAEIIRRIFQRFIEVQSPKQIAHELNSEGIKTRQGKDWIKPQIYRILNNYTYIGQVNYKGHICEGEQEGIIEMDIWNRVQEILKANAPMKNSDRGRMETLAPLKGILRCGHCGCAMIPTYTKKKHKKYFYYVCDKDAKRAIKTCPVNRMAAGEIEGLALEQIALVLKSKSFYSQVSEVLEVEAEAVLDLFTPITEVWEEMNHGERHRLANLLLGSAVIFDDRLELELKVSGLENIFEELKKNAKNNETG
jgi:site-specific DNA recombinase